ncbi:MAG: M28 family peptidase [Phycisphaerales bacterium]
MPVRTTTARSSDPDQMIARTVSPAWMRAAARFAALTIPMLAGACAADGGPDRSATQTPVKVTGGTGEGTDGTSASHAGAGAATKAPLRPDPADSAPAPRAITAAEAVEALGDSPIAAVLDVLGSDAKAFNAHVITLSNPFFEGRQPGTRGNTLAADYIERYYREAGLAPAFAMTTMAADGAEVLTPNATYRQPFPTGARLDRVTRERVEFVLGDERRELRPRKDFTVLGCTGDGAVTAPVVFVGYSIVAGGEDGSYNSYPPGVDLTGKIALILRFEPMNEEGKSKWAASGWSPSAGLEAKIDAAVQLGAAGIVLVNPPGAADPRANRLADTESTSNLGIEPGIPAVMIATEHADALAAAGGAGSLMDLRRRADEAGGTIVELAGVAVTLDAAMIRQETTTDNVGGILAGRGALADEFIIIGAHYDHVGTGSTGASPRNVGKMHPGADDNGSGTSGVLVLMDKLARAYAELPADADARSIMFVTFSSEEAGLIGSQFFVRNPPVPLDRVHLMLNMDMIGRLRDGQLEVGGVGTGKGLREWLKPFLDESGLTIKMTSSGFGPSDHASFAGAKVPVLFFFTGLHREYHTPADVGSTVNQKGAARVIGLGFEIIMAMTRRPEPWRDAKAAEAIKADAAAENKPAPEPAQPLAAGPMRVKVRFGIAPGDYSGAEPGVLVGDVYEGTSAADAGIKAGDLMTSWNGAELKSVEAWMPLLAGANPGDIVDIALVRDGKPMTVKVTLKARDEGGR